MPLLPFVLPPPLLPIHFLHSILHLFSPLFYRTFPLSSTLHLLTSTVSSLSSLFPPLPPLYTPPFLSTPLSYLFPTIHLLSSVSSPFSNLPCIPYTSLQSPSTPSSLLFLPIVFVFPFFFHFYLSPKFNTYIFCSFYQFHFPY